MENIYGVDVFIAAVVLVSAMLSFSRGFISEMLGIGSWLIATIVGFYAMPYLALKSATASDSFNMVKFTSSQVLTNSFTVSNFF